MSTSEPLSFGQRLTGSIEAFLMTYIVPKHQVGRFFSGIFKIPLLFHRIGLDSLIQHWILIITTTGRRSGLPCTTPLGFSYDLDRGAFIVMSGWEGRTDWYRNARANPRVRVWALGKEFAAVAEPASELEVAPILKDIIQLNPRSINMLSRWSEVEIDGSQESLTAAAPHFPVLLLKPSDEMSFIV
jgi:deazaflavin-dependent oxidoreductase (nitroreductase family)